MALQSNGASSGLRKEVDQGQPLEAQPPTRLLSYSMRRSPLNPSLPPSPSLSAEIGFAVLGMHHDPFDQQPSGGQPALPQRTLGAFAGAASSGLYGPFARETVPTGLIDAFVKTCQRWQLDEQQQLVLLGYGEEDFIGHQLLRGRWRSISQDAKDRTGYVLGISLGLGSIFNEDVAAELAWLNTPHPRLANQAPLPFMLQGKMVQLIAVASLVAEERGLP